MVLFDSCSQAHLLGKAFVVVVVLKRYGILKLLEIFFLVQLSRGRRQPLTCMIQIMVLGLYKQLLGCLVERATQMEQMHCPLWWQMQETAVMLQFQV